VIGVAGGKVVGAGGMAGAAGGAPGIIVGSVIAVGAGVPLVVTLYGLDGTDLLPAVSTVTTV